MQSWLSFFGTSGLWWAVNTKTSTRGTAEPHPDATLSPGLTATFWLLFDVRQGLRSPVLWPNPWSVSVGKTLVLPFPQTSNNLTTNKLRSAAAPQSARWAESCALPQFPPLLCFLHSHHKRGHTCSTCQWGDTNWTCLQWTTSTVVCKWWWHANLLPLIRMQASHRHSRL